MPPLVSILIPCYNAEKWIVQTLQSALAQTWNPTEIIVVDDGSTDSSLELISAFGPRGVRIISQEHQNASAARNRALREALGDYVQFLDADDLLASDKIEIQVNDLLKAGSNYVASGPWGYFRGSTAQTRFIRKPHWKNMAPVEFLTEMWEHGGMMAPNSWLIPRPMIERAGPWNEALTHSDDAEYFCRILLSSNGVRFCENAKAYYRKGHNHRLSAMNSIEKIRSRETAIRLSVEGLLAAENSVRTKRACAARYQGFAYAVYPRTPSIWKAARRLALELSNGTKPPMTAINPCAQWFSRFLGWKFTRCLHYLAARLGL